MSSRATSQAAAEAFVADYARLQLHGPAHLLRLYHHTASFVHCENPGREHSGKEQLYYGLGTLVSGTWRLGHIVQVVLSPDKRFFVTCQGYTTISGQNYAYEHRLTLRRSIQSPSLHVLCHVFQWLQYPAVRAASHPPSFPRRHRHARPSAPPQLPPSWVQGQHGGSLEPVWIAETSDIPKTADEAKGRSKACQTAKTKACQTSRALGAAEEGGRGRGPLGPECPICLERMDAVARRPVVTPCGHSLCEECAGRGSLRRCPCCRHSPLPVPLAPNVALLALLEQLQ